MAANIIGVKKGIIIANMRFVHAMMFNPRIISRSGSYETEEVCLSLDGVRPCTHYYNIVVEYTDMEVVLRINFYCSRYDDNGTESGVKISVNLVLEIEDPTVIKLLNLLAEHPAQTQVWYVDELGVSKRTVS